MSSIRKFPAEIYQLFAEHNNFILLEWDLINDSFFTSQKWIDTFGYAPDSHNFSHTLFATPFIHSDDRIIIQRYFSKVKQSNLSDSQKINFTTVKVRFINMINEYVWCRLHLLTIFSQLNHPIKIIGMISEVCLPEPPAEDEPVPKKIAPQEEAENVDAAACHNFFDAYNTIEHWIYIVDKDTYELKFLNRAFIAYLRYNPQGRKCYAAFHRRSEPCENCPLLSLSYDTRKALKETFDKPTRRWLKIAASHLPLDLDYTACLVQISDITAKKEFEYMPTM